MSENGDLNLGTYALDLTNVHFSRRGWDVVHYRPSVDRYWVTICTYVHVFKVLLPDLNVFQEHSTRPGLKITTNVQADNCSRFTCR